MTHETERHARPLGCRVATGIAAMALFLSACGSVAAGAPGAITAPHGSVAGRVSAGPTCPVERVGHPCPPRPIVAHVEVRTGRTVVAATQSRSDGTYRLEVVAGTYTLVVVPNGVFPRCTPRTVSVTANDTVRANIMCDTGIR